MYTIALCLLFLVFCFGLSSILSIAFRHKTYKDFGYIKFGRVRLYFHKFTDFLYFFVIEPGEDGWTDTISMTVLNTTIVFHIKTKNYKAWDEEYEGE